MADHTGKHDAAWALLADNGLAAPALTELLTEAIAGGTVGVEAVEPAIIGTGQVGENVRCNLTWDGPAEGLPASVVVKLASSDETSRAAAEATRTYIREVGFYRDVAPSVAIRVPTAHHVSEDRDNNRFVLVMEDITPARVGDQLSGCDLAQAELALRAAADLHGSTWGRTEELGALDWVDESTPERVADRTGLFQMLYPGFLDRYRDRLTTEEIGFGDWLARSYQQLQEAGAGAQCLVHGDFRLDNMLFGTDGHAPPLTTVDWQTPGLGPGLLDVAYFLSGSLDPAELQAAETALLAGYRARLAEHGVTLGEDEVWRGYRLASPAGYVMAVIASQLVGQTERGDDMFMVMAKGSAAQAISVDVVGLFD